MALEKNGWNAENAINAYFVDPNSYQPGQKNMSMGAG
jgi:hypothetical protein